MRRLCLLGLLICHSNAMAAIRTVGGSLNCSHRTIRAAFASASVNAEEAPMRTSNQLTHIRRACSTPGWG